MQKCTQGHMQLSGKYKVLHRADPATSRRWGGEGQWEVPLEEKAEAIKGSPNMRLGEAIKDVEWGTEIIQFEWDA